MVQADTHVQISFTCTKTMANIVRWLLWQNSAFECRAVGLSRGDGMVYPHHIVVPRTLSNVRHLEKLHCGMGFHGRFLLMSMLDNVML
jgi:hypothetical protein